ncbi:MAG: hypothetical protein DCF30_06260, partial [Hyphomicrobiales bacterium]
MAIITGAASVIGIYASQRMGATVDSIAKSASAIRNHTIGDMLHDGMRADVYAALIRSETGAESAETVKETLDHAKEFRERIATTKSLVASAESQRKLTELDKPLDDYISQAVRIVELAFADRKAAFNEMPSFDARFTALEEAMETVGNALEQEALAVQSNAAWTRKLADVSGIASLVIALLTAGWLFMTVLRSIVRPISHIVASMRQLSAGEADVAIPHATRRDEIGEMARTIGQFQQSLNDRAAEEQRRTQGELNASETQRRGVAETTHQIGLVVEAAARGDFS